MSEAGPSMDEEYQPEWDDLRERRKADLSRKRLHRQDAGGQDSLDRPRRMRKATGRAKQGFKERRALREQLLEDWDED